MIGLRLARWAWDRLGTLGHRIRCGLWALGSALCGDVVCAIVGRKFYIDGRFAGRVTECEITNDLIDITKPGDVWRMFKGGGRSRVRLVIEHDA
jgi:hypothetical protein